MIKVVLATGEEDLNRHVKGLPWVEVAGVAQYKEAVADVVRSGEGEVLLLSAYLKGSEDITSVVFTARAAGLRVVFLAGDISQDDPLIADIVAMGVYDILFNPMGIDQIEARIRTPAPFSDAVRLLRIKRKPEGKRLRGVIARFLPAPTEEEETQAPRRRFTLPHITLPEIRLPRVSLASSPEGGAPAAAMAAGESAMVPSVAAQAFPEKADRQAKKKPGLVIVQRSLAARVWLVIGAAPRVGATSFALALTAYAAQRGEPVKIADGGGGVSKWLKDEGTNDLLVPVSAEFAAAPGEITIVDSGVEAKELALAQVVVWVTDLSPGSVNVSNLIPGKTFLVGTRGAPLRGIEELAELKGLTPLGVLPESQQVKEAQLNGTLPRPRNWQKCLARCFKALAV